MVYGFVLIGSLLVGAVYWIFTTCGGEAAHELMWSPTSGLIEPEPWLQGADGGYAGWSPGSSAYAAWSPGAYLNLGTTTTTIYVPTTSTTQRTSRSRRTRLPSQFPPDSDPDSPKPPSSMSSSDPDDHDKDKFPEEDRPPTDLHFSDEKINENYEDNKIHKQPPGLHKPPPVVQIPTTEPSEIDVEYSVNPPGWRSRDQNEEAYEENPQDLVNTRPPDKLPVQGWGYDYGN